MCHAQKYIVMKHCRVVKAESLIEFGYIEDYEKQRIDTEDSFFYEYWAVSAVIRNLPTPFFVNTESPPISLKIYDGAADDRYFEDRIFKGEIDFYINDL